MHPAPPAQFPLGPFRPYEKNPILRPRGTSWESGHVYNPAAVVKDGQVVLLYRAHADDIVSHVGLATSDDGYTFDRRPDPVLSPSEAYDVHGCEDPRVTEVDGTYYLTYTGWDGDAAVQLCLATSTDLVTWEKHGPIFPEFNTFRPAADAPTGPWSKAGAILGTPIDGRYLMYFGEGSIYHAWSDDLIHWTPGSNDEPIMTPQPGTYTSFLVEVGPPPIITDNGLILMLHNAAVKNGDGSVRYTCGQILFDPARPTEILARMDRPWLEPETFEDTHGLVSNVTFVEGLVFFEDAWFAYYGQSDSTLGVAVHRVGDTYARPA
ncbi:MAG: glycoside hydrolase family 130 protein [Nocardioidaceae bacterium]